MEVKKLNKVEDIEIGLKCYQYDKINFLLNLKSKTEKLVVFFHGLVYPNENIFFAKTKWECYDIQDENISVLSINDKVLEENRHLITTAFHETEQIKCHQKYIDIMQKLEEIINPQKIIMMGVSIGAFPAVYFGSLLSKVSKLKIIVVCFNSYLYFDELYNKSNKKLLNNDNVIKINIEETLIESKIDNIHIYVNRNDTTFFNSSSKFIYFCKKNTKYNPKCIVFDNMERYNNGHSTFLPNDNTFESIVLHL